MEVRYNYDRPANDKEYGRIQVSLEYADASDTWALLEELMAEDGNDHNLPQFEGASKYHRLPQFGGDPGFRDVWYNETDGEDDMFENLVRMAINTESDQACLGYAYDRMPEAIQQNVPADPYMYEQEMLEFVKSLAPIDIALAMESNEEAFITKLAINAARRVAQALNHIG
jgi:hypothetical protein